MTIRLYPLPTLFDDSVTAVRDATPINTSAFYLSRPNFVPWSSKPTAFVLETDEPAAQHTFNINRTATITIVPGASVLSLNLQLLQGPNRIEVSTPSQRSTFTLASTGIETWLRALGREYYLDVQRRLTDIRNQLLTPWTTRISAHFLPYTDLFVPARMPKIQQTRLAVLTSMGERLGYGDGVRTVASALSYSTPYVTRPRDSEFTVPGFDHIYPGVTSYPTTGENVGRVFDLWFLNSCLAAKQALVQLCLSVGAPDVPSPKPLSLQSFDDRQVLLKFNEGDTEVHIIDPLSPECSDIEFDTSCAASVRTFAEIVDTIDIVMNTPQLPLDEAVEHPLLFGFWDEGYSLDGFASSGPGLGGGDSVFDTIDLDDPFGTGFEGFSLSRRFDAPACWDTREQRGQRMVKFTYPLLSTTGLSPAEKVTGTPAVVDADVGAPSPSIGNSLIWVVAPRTYLYEKDRIRVEAPDTDIEIASAWPVFDVDAIVKTDPAGVVTFVGTQVKIVASTPGFFEFQHTGMGVRIGGTDLACIVSVSDEGSEAILAGNPALIAGAAIVNVYEPLRDRKDTTFSPFTGRRTYEVTLSTPLPLTLLDGDVLDYRIVPRANGAFLIGDTTIQASLDLVALPGDRFYLTTGTYAGIDGVAPTGLYHHTTGLPISSFDLDTPLAAPLADNEALYSIRADPCWQNGDPVTPLMVISLVPTAYLS